MEFRAIQIVAAITLLGILPAIRVGGESESHARPRFAHQNVLSMKDPSASQKLASGWRVEAIKLPGEGDLTSVFFSDLSHGWIGSEKALYKTEDGGKTWQRNKLSIPEGATVQSISFPNRQLGWVVLQIRTTGYGDENDHFWVMQTTDAGLSWKLQLEDKLAVVKRVSFSDENEGWLTGARFPSIPFVWHTIDQGQHWTNVSANFKKNIGPLDNGWITDLYPEGKLKAKALTLVGRVFGTEDGGMNWREITHLEDEPAQTCICHLGVKQDKTLWVAGGALSIEGVWGMIAVKLPDHTWSRRRIDPFLADAKFISNEEIIVSGGVRSKADRKLDGLILYSPDEGLNWSTIYENPQGGYIGHLFAVDSKHIWALGAEGLVVSIVRSQGRMVALNN